ncbi:MAG: Energy-coupling factor transporter transmembrane protein EcfT [Methanosaeta sp. PtaB.Bin039]|nr:MAG: Energy-coupling factor transporter transmembrane protein EcfT [Methanosaeta sp. PtaB.Bin039]OPY46669.1 MAG: Energy-coupling factor transporter transmembrane protein EcfT [Methanosaeta sp. PtaU1.Bin028]
MTKVDDSPWPSCQAQGGRRDFVRKTLDGILSFLQEAFVTREISSKKGLLQSLDPRIKLISVLALVFALTTVRDLRVILIFYMITIVIAHLSGISLSFFVKRVWLFIPIFTGVIALPMIFNVFLPGQPLYHLLYLGPSASLGPFALPESIYITREGVWSACVFTLRVAACVSAVVLLFLTTSQAVLFRSLRSVGVPKVYVLTLEMANRYVFLFLEIIRDLYTAKRSRTIISRGTWAEQRWVGGRIGYMLIKSLDLSERVHQAMISRGFNGDVKIIEEYRIGLPDYLAGALALASSALMILYD